MKAVRHDSGVGAATMTYQLRRYEVREGCLETFVSVWRDQLLPLRRSFGFEVLGPWVLPETNEFVWIVGHETFESAATEYYGSPERKRVSPRPRDLLQTVNAWEMVSIDGWMASQGEQPS